MEIIKSFRWQKIAVIYDSELNLPKLQHTFNDFSKVDNSGKQSVSFFKLPTDTDDYQPMLKSISKSGIVQVIVDCTMEKTYSVLKQSVKVGMANEYVVRNWIINFIHVQFSWICKRKTSLTFFYSLQSYFLLGGDGYTIDLTPLPDMKSNITTIRLLNPNIADVYAEERQPYFRENRYYRRKYNANLMTVSYL